MTPYRIRRHRQRRHGASHFALVPFIDMMTILVVFLLAHTADVDILPNTKNIQIPQSLSDRKPSAAVVVMVTKDSVFVDGQLVGSVADVIASPAPVFAPLRTALLAQNDKILRGERQAGHLQARSHHHGRQEPALQRSETNHAHLQRRRVRQGVVRGGRA